jgi:hypothetical protein
MSNTTLTADIIAKAALAVLDNELVMAKKVFRGYEEEFDKKINGYTPGETISVRRPTDFTVRDGATMNLQDATEGQFSITVNKQKGIDFAFSSSDLTLKIPVLTERIIKPAMVQLANQVDLDLMALYKDIPSWQGASATTPINTYAKFAAGPQRMDEYANPTDGRCCVLAPADHWGLIGSQTALYIQKPAESAYRKGSLGEIGGVDTYMSQNVPVHTVGADVGGTVNSSVTTSTVTYASVKDTNQQTITSSSVDFNAGDVFTIDDVYAVNPVTKAKLSFLKQFTVVSYSSNTLVFSPAMVWTGAFQNVSVTAGVTDLNTKAITGVGTANTAYRQNMFFTEGAFALVSVPMVKPPGAVEVSRQSYKGTNVRVIPVYDGTNDVSKWRLDILYGVKTIDQRLAHRLSGSS